jgi:hypothetical protein
VLRDKVDLIRDESVVGGRDEDHLVRGNAFACCDGDQVHGHEEQNEGRQDLDVEQGEGAPGAVRAACQSALK